MKKLLVLIAGIAMLTGCASSTDYLQYLETQKNIAASVSAAEVARYTALQAIGSSGDTTTKVASVMALQKSDANLANSVQLQAPKSAEDVAFRWASLFLPATIQGVSIYKNASVAINQSNNNAAVAMDTNKTMLGLSTGTVVGAPGSQLLFPLQAP